MHDLNYFKSSSYASNPWADLPQWNRVSAMAWNLISSADVRLLDHSTSLMVYFGGLDPKNLPRETVPTDEIEACFQDLDGWQHDLFWQGHPHPFLCALAVCLGSPARREGGILSQKFYARGWDRVRDDELLNDAIELFLSKKYVTLDTQKRMIFLNALQTLGFLKSHKNFSEKTAHTCC